MTRLFNSISVISGRCAGNNEWLCAMKFQNPICIKCNNLEFVCMYVGLYK